MGGRDPGQHREVPTRIHSVVEVSDRMREIRLRGPDLTRLRCAPGAHVVGHVPTPDGQVRRVYSVPARARPAGCCNDIWWRDGVGRVDR